MPISFFMKPKTNTYFNEAFIFHRSLVKFHKEEEEAGNRLSMKSIFGKNANITIQEEEDDLR